ncbi:acetyl-CoA acyltransferase 1 [Rhinolophus ferrumequinum]|uniref:Acetyl-CoA acyltransferase 1 n=1 Tax=Rhinolophus ferrumequinum TaxID=59479 RepID=A0A7J7UHY4_RHIFE|nr:acetyl-CoA acyltransferase 1 [Rhinolophus ferrumequinum]
MSQAPRTQGPSCLGANPSLVVEVGTNQIIQNDCKIGKKYMMLSPDKKLVTSRHLSIIYSPAPSESQIPSVFSRDFPGQPKHVEGGGGRDFASVLELWAVYRPRGHWCGSAPVRSAVSGL